MPQRTTSLYYHRDPVCCNFGDDFCEPCQASEKPENPRLVLQITVDQLRGDLPRRYLAKMGSGGFRYLLENGVVYANAHHDHAAKKPDDVPDENWLSINRKDEDLSIKLRIYVPDEKKMKTWTASKAEIIK